MLIKKERELLDFLYDNIFNVKGSKPKIYNFIEGDLYNVYISFKYYMDNSTKKEILYFKDKLNNGLVDGDEYYYLYSDCLCYIGYLAKLREIDTDEILDKEGKKLKNCFSDFETFLFPIRRGNTPQNYIVSLVVDRMIDIYLENNKIGE